MEMVSLQEESIFCEGFLSPYSRNIRVTENLWA